MPTWKLTIEYDGTRYRGWQAQTNTDRTVQGVLLRAVREVLGPDATTGGAGRTDAGVQDLDKVAHVRARRKVAPGDLVLAQQFESEDGDIVRGVNDLIPHDVNVLSAEPAPTTFHARHDAMSRTYLYRISRRRTAFDKRFVWWVRDRLDSAAMARAAVLFVGRRDFSSFCENAEGQQSTVVVVERSAVTEEGQEIRFRVEASHFLWKMVRRLVGTLVEVGRGNVSAEEVAKLLDERSAEPARWTAPPSGLFLESVKYPATGGIRGG